MEEERRDNGAKGKARENKRRKSARGGPGGMEEAEAAWESAPATEGCNQRVPGAPTLANMFFPAGAELGNWGPRRLGQRAQPEPAQNEAGLGVELSKDRGRRNAPRKVAAP